MVERLVPLTYLVDVNGQLWKRHIDHLQVRSDTLSKALPSVHGESSTVLSSPEPSVINIPFDNSCELSHNDDPVVSSANIELNTSLSEEQSSTSNDQGPVASEQVLNRRYPSRIRKPPERYQPDSS